MDAEGLLEVICTKRLFIMKGSQRPAQGEAKWGMVRKPFMPETCEMVPEGLGPQQHCTEPEVTSKTGSGPAEGLSLWNYQRKKNFKIEMHAIDVKTTIFPSEVH